jgi:hypothetical protein
MKLIESSPSVELGDSEAFYTFSPGSRKCKKCDAKISKGQSFLRVETKQMRFGPKGVNYCRVCALGVLETLRNQVNDLCSRI